MFRGYSRRTLEAVSAAKRCLKELEPRLEPRLEPTRLTLTASTAATVTSDMAVRTLTGWCCWRSRRLKSTAPSPSSSRGSCSEHQLVQVPFQSAGSASGSVGTFLGGSMERRYRASASPRLCSTCKCMHRQ